MLENREYEVAVCGGGFAGIAAALSAARAGAKVALFEKQYMLGGLGTAGLVTIYLPLCDGMGHQVSFGIAEELFRLSIKYGAEDMYPANWLDGVGNRDEKSSRFQVRYNAQVFAILAERLLLDAGVDILYGSYAVDTILEDGKISALITESKSGRCAYYVKSVIDATGDCDIAHFSGAPTSIHERGNSLAAWYYYTDENGYDLKRLGAADVPNPDPNTKFKELTSRRFSGLETRDVSDFVTIGHEKLLADWLKRREENPEAVISTIATIPQFRMTRKLVGEYQLTEEDNHKYFEDSVGMVANWRKRGPIYEVPFRALYSRSVKNLAVAGRCISSDEALWDIIRVIPCCAVEGEAVGLAAAMTDDFTTLDVAVLQSKLKQNGVVLHEKDLI
jgi:hypothetical protein